MTTYQFTINSKAFPKALDIYSQFFKSPLFDSDSLSREIIAIDSEDSKNRIIDGRRNLQILKHLLHSNSRYEKFSTGNIKTLGKSSSVNNINFDYIQNALKPAMLQFYNYHYVPRNMVLALVGPQSLSELETYANDYFADITNASPEPHHIKKPRLIPFSASAPLPVTVKTSSEVTASVEKTHQDATETLTAATATQSQSTDINQLPTMNSNYPFKVSGQIIRARPIADVNEISIMYSFPFSMRHMYRRNPIVLLSYLMANKYKHSLYDTLFSDKKYVLTLSAGLRENFVDFCLFEVNMKLTQKGLDHYEEVVSIVNRYLRFIEQQFTLTPVSESNLQYLNDLWHELHVSQEIDFKYQERSSGYELVQGLVDNMMRYPSQHVFSGGWLSDDQFLSQQPTTTTADTNADITNNSSSYTLLKTLLSDYMIPQRSLTFLRCTAFRDWLPGDASDLDLTDAVLTHQIENNDVDAIFHTNNTLTSKEGYRANRVEPYYGLPYHMDTLPHQTMLRWNSSRFSSHSDANTDNDNEWQRPPLNPFICDELLTRDHSHSHSGIGKSDAIEFSPTVVDNNKTLISIPHSSYPRLLVSSDSNGNDVCKDVNGINKDETKRTFATSNQQLWYSPDELFHTPKSTIALFILTPLCGDSHPLNSLVSTVYSQLSSFKYYAPSIAGLEYSTQVNNRGLQLTVSGYTPKLKKLMLDLCHDWFTHAHAHAHVHEQSGSSVWSNMTDEYFFNLKARSIQNIQSWNTNRPDTQADTVLNYILEENVKLPSEVLTLTQTVEKQHVLDRVSVLRNKTKTIMYVHGDLNQDEAVDLYRELDSLYLGSSPQPSVFNITEFQRIQSLGHGNKNTNALNDESLKFQNIKLNTVTPPPAEVMYEVPARARVLTSPGHARVILPAFNPSDANSALITYFQVHAYYYICIYMLY